MKKKRVSDSVTVNARARYDYELGDELICGMALSGPEVRSIRDHHVQLKGSFVTIRGGE
jgi:SsrA-binding protein